MPQPSRTFVTRHIQTGAIVYCGRDLQSARMHALTNEGRCRVWFPDGHSEYPIGVHVLTGSTQTVLMTREYYERCEETLRHESRGLLRMAD